MDNNRASTSLTAVTAFSSCYTLRHKDCKPCILSRGPSRFPRILTIRSGATVSPANPCSWLLVHHSTRHDAADTHLMGSKSRSSLQASLRDSLECPMRASAHEVPSATGLPTMMRCHDIRIWVITLTRDGMSGSNICFQRQMRKALLAVHSQNGRDILERKRIEEEASARTREVYQKYKFIVDRLKSTC